MIQRQPSISITEMSWRQLQLALSQTREIHKEAIGVESIATIQSLERSIRRMELRDTWFWIPHLFYFETKETIAEIRAEVQAKYDAVKSMHDE